MAAKYRSLAASRARAFLLAGSPAARVLGPNSLSIPLERVPGPGEPIPADANAAPIPTVRDLVSRMCLARGESRAHPFVLKLPVSAALNQGACREECSRFVETFETDKHLPAVALVEAKDPNSSGWFHFNLPTEEFVQNVLQLAVKQAPYEFRRNGLFPEEEPKNVVVEFSSPNVAKPFHAGHLRSTILGNFCANICEAVGHNVARLNWLGDWGTQFGLLAAGLQEESQLNVEDLCEDAIHKLHQVYVQANKTAEGNPEFAALARQLFALLEQGDPELRGQWKLIRDYTIEELEKVYERLGIRFDQYHGEAMYGNEYNQAVMNQLEEKGLLELDDDGRKVTKVFPGQENERPVTLVKSDGSSLYVSRDCAAAIDRAKQFHFDHMYYVVDNGQSEHFVNLFNLLQQLGYDWANNLSHIKFGRIRGVRSRKGQGVYLRDILDEARDKLKTQMEESPNARELEDPKETADILGMSAVLINDLKNKRTKDYEFTWKRALQSTGDSGIKLQYTHSRLTSLLAVNGLLKPEEDLADLGCKSLSTLVEPSALALILTLARFDEKVRDAYVDMEPSVLVHYLFKLSNEVSKAIKVLPVKAEADEEKAKARLVLFGASRAVLRQGLAILGIKPLDKI